MKETKKLVVLLIVGAFFIWSLSFVYLPKFSATEFAQGQVGGAIIEVGDDLPLTPNVPALTEPPKPQLTGTMLLAELSAVSVLVKDPVSSVVLYEKAATTQVPVASLTKLMTALVVEKYASLDDVVEIADADTETVAYRANLVPGEKIRVIDLLRLMLVGSANDAALALGRSVTRNGVDFVGLMNLEARALGMSQTSFRNPVGFDNPQHYSSAQDLSTLVTEFMKHPQLMEIVKLKNIVVSSVAGKFPHPITTTNKLMLDHPEIIGFKTGYTTEAKGELIVLVDLAEAGTGSGSYYSIVLGSNNREADTETIMNWVKNNFTWTPLDK